MLKTKFWLAQLLMLSVLGLILGSPAFAKAPEHSKGVSMKNANANDKAKEKANSNAGFENVVEEPIEEPPVEEPPTVDPIVLAQAQCDALYGSFASLNTSSMMCTNILTFESTQL